MTALASFFERHTAQLAFNEHCELVASGAKLPSLADLIQGCPFYKDHIWSDADAFARLATDRLGAINDSKTSLLFALAELTVAPGLDDFLHAARQLEASVGTPLGEAVSAEHGAARCHFYAAISGNLASAKHVAAYAISGVRSADVPADRATSHSRGALAWKMAAAGQLSVPEKWTRETASEFLAPTDNSGSIGGEVLVRTVRGRTRSGRATSNETVKTSEPVQAGPISPKPTEQNVLPTDDSDGSAEDGADTAENDEPRTVVVTAIGNPQSSEGRRVSSEFSSVVGTALRLVRTPDLARVQRDLMADFPHAQAITDTILSAIPGPAHLQLPPTVFVGPPGSGKSSYAVRLAELLGIPAEVFPCGGVSDAALAGTPRRWTTGEPSVPVSLIRAHQCASPAIILDEIEKVGTCRNNGSLLDALLGLLEPRTARCWRDPYIEAAVDLRHVVWLGTANSLEGVPRALLDRLRVIAFPPPRAEHVGTLAQTVIARLARERGLDARWLPPLDGVELGALSRAWSDGSLRTLARMVSAVLSMRPRFDVCH